MSLVLDSLEIKNFRAFKHLRIEKLGRVNLIVGKNNVGKSSILEALWLYAEKAEPSVIYRILSQRDEIVLDSSETGRSGINPHERALALNNLFFDRKDTRYQHEAIFIGSVNDKDDNIQIDVDWPMLSRLKNGEASQSAEVDDFSPQSPTFALFFGAFDSVHVSFNHSFAWGERVVPPDYAAYVNAFVVGANGLSSFELSVLWDTVALSDLEEEVIVALKIVAPEVLAVNLIGNERIGSLRIPKARTISSNRPIPLRSLGEGMNRMFGIALALVNAKDGMLLIDEVDTGLHYSVLPDLWKLIFEVAHRLNVQVFATSHSWDCIQAFQQAAEENKEEEGVLIRLESRRAGIGAVTFDEGELAVVTREQIEVR